MWLESHINVENFPKVRSIDRIIIYALCSSAVMISIWRTLQITLCRVVSILKHSCHHTKVMANTMGALIDWGWLDQVV